MRLERLARRTPSFTSSTRHVSLVTSTPPTTHLNNCGRRWRTRASIIHAGLHIREGVSGLLTAICAKDSTFGRRLLKGFEDCEGEQQRKNDLKRKKCCYCETSYCTFKDVGPPSQCRYHAGSKCFPPFHPHFRSFHVASGPQLTRIGLQELVQRERGEHWQDPEI
jgi:hypothetical protein